MTSRALCGCWLVNQHQPAFDFLQLLVTRSTTHVLVRTFQGECCLLVVNERRPPLRTLVALSAARDGVPLCELRAVHVLVAFLALRWS